MKVNIEYSNTEGDFVSNCEVIVDAKDVWGLDATLARIILPSLIKLKYNLVGSPNTDLDDGDFIEDIHDRWICVLDKMIWSFENILNDKSMEFSTPIEGKDLFEFAEEDEKGYCSLTVNVEVDRKALDEYNQRIQKGLDLFAKYYRGLWV